LTAGPVKAFASPRSTFCCADLLVRGSQNLQCAAGDRGASRGTEPAHSTLARKSCGTMVPQESAAIWDEMAAKCLATR